MKRKIVCRFLSFSVALLMLPQSVMAAEVLDGTDGSTDIPEYEAGAESTDTVVTGDADTNVETENITDAESGITEEGTSRTSQDGNVSDGTGSDADTYASGEGTTQEYATNADTSDLEAASVLSYDEGIARLYDQSMSITDGEILSTAQSMVSDLSVLESAVAGREDAQDILGVVKQFEVEKADYMQGSLPSPAYQQAVLSELDKQYGYMNDYVVPASEVVEIIPRIDVLSANVDDSRVTASVAEWNTVGYSEGGGENASAYEYDFTLTLLKDSESGIWFVSSVSDTDQNFTWIYDSEELEETMTPEQDTTVYEEDLEAYGIVNEYGVSTISGITYDPSKAVAYADKWWNSSNSEFPSYVKSGVDCANFVSQCLNAGGIERTTSFAPSKSAWINCIYQIKYLTSIGGKLIEKCSASDVKTGNPVYYDWDGGSAKVSRYPFAKGVMKYDYDHVGICVGYNTSGVPVVDAHTSARYHVKYDLNAKTVSTIQLVTDDSPDTEENADAKKNTAADSNSLNTQNSDSSKTSSYTGFKKDNGKTYYYVNDKVQTGWQYIEKKWYYFNGQGVMQTGFVTVGGKKYYLDPGTGAMKTGWQKIGGSWYYFNGSGAMLTGWQELSWSGGKSWFYFDSNGIMKTGWQKIGGSWYYFNGSGAMLTGWQELSWSGGKSWFHFANNGKMSVNTTVDGYKVDKNGARISNSNTSSSKSSSSNSSSKKNGWVKSGSYWYYYTNGTLQRGWKYINKKWYYLSETHKDGRMVTGWGTIGEKKYYFGGANDGAMKIGWQKISGSWYYFNGSGAVQTGWMYLGWSGGKSWFYAGSDGKLVNGWNKLKWSGGTNWFYFDKNCAMAANTTVDGYKIDANGVRK